jgi:sterol 24-C-methyltransferase
MAPTALEQENLSRDADFNKAMHGKSAKSRGGFAAMSGKDTAAQKAAVDEYFKHWDNKGHEEETAETREVSARNSSLTANLSIYEHF